MSNTIQNQFQTLYKQTKILQFLGLAQWYHLAILGLENSYTSGEATSIGI